MKSGRRRVPGGMGRIKDKVIREQDAKDAARKAASPDPGRVPEGGGDEMNWNTQTMDAMINPKDDAPEPAPESGEHAVADALEKDFERGVTPDGVQLLPGSELKPLVPEDKRDEEPCSEPPESQPNPDDPTPESAKANGDFWNEEAAEEAAPVSIVKGGEAADKAYPDLSGVTVRKVPHQNLILEGVCSHCGHCGHKLTDAQSVQRGIGPVCSKKGYSEDFVEGDEIQAMIDLSEFPELVDFLTEHYKPLGIRGLINGLVRVASLNRPRGRNWADGNAKVHAACCDAIQALGHLKMADLLRETLVIMEVRESKTVPGALEVWVKRSEWTKYWSYDIRCISGTYFSRPLKAQVVPVKDPKTGSPKLTGKNRTMADGKVVKETAKAALWALMQRHYEGCVARVNGKPVTIKK